ncbi:protein disulfide-isomerase 5-1-like [Bidens hawaiensis]|uniref:protein disulfide-isomerase 5-1-like n=1 Tax=Bidens hawaiensis TaxID=980011 RepID=UPI00404B2B7C
MKANHQSLLFTVVLISSVLLSIFVLDSRAEVITLTETTFSDKVKEKDTAWFVKFCVPWCKHCKSLGSLWEDLGKTMEGEDEIEVGEVDCGTNKPLCSKVKIGSYPTFKLFYNGEEVARYRGTRDVESMRTFVLEETQKATAAAVDAHLQDDKEL